MMNCYRKYLRSVVEIIWAVLGLVLLPTLASATTTKQPISDFVDAQGTTFVFVPPVADFIGFTNIVENLCASVDYAGLANEFKEVLYNG